MENRTTIQLSEGLRKELRTLAAARDCSYQELLSEMIAVFRELDSSRTIISIPDKLSEKIKGKLDGTDMGSVSEYITFLLRMVLAEDASASDEAKIKKKLKSLGYL